MEKQITKKEIKNMIYEVRGEQVILDRNLSYLLDIETRVLNQQVKRNLELFSESHYFQMNEEEFLSWKSQFVMSDNDKLGLRRAPYVFTKEGILTLDRILKSKIGKEVIKTILEVFDSLNNNQIVLKSPGIRGNIVSRIYEIRGKQVMLDSDLAKLYKVETKRINEAVRNNPEKFPERFSWKLTEEECLNLRSKISTSSWNNYGGRRYKPQVFTEQGIAMLATILKSDIATKISIAIMDAI